MDAGEFKQVCIDMGRRDVTDEQVHEMIIQVDRNNDKLIQWNEFLDVSSYIRVLIACIDVQEPEDHKQRSVFTNSHYQGR